MTISVLARALGIACLVTLAACASRIAPDGGLPDTGSRDVAIDQGRTDAGSDVPMMVDAPLDTARDGNVGVDVRDTGPTIDVVSDTGVADTATIDTGTTNTCVAAGGACVALVPGACPAPGMVGSAGTYSCGGGLGVECCLPGDAGTPPIDSGVADTGGPVTCMSAGGMCVALVPGSCPAPRMVGSATMYSCGGGLGVECCLPAPSADAGGPVTCMSAGGMCVALVPGSCPAPRMVGSATMYSCGGGLGVECCLPGPSVDAGGPVTCASAGGSCVGLFPGACPPPGMVGSATMYSCGGGLGLECCLPGSATDAGTSNAPSCLHVGTTMEGWYAADGTLLCPASCAGLTPRCQRVGSAAQGWYTTSGNGCPPFSTLIVHDAMCM